MGYTYKVKVIVCGGEPSELARIINEELSDKQIVGFTFIGNNPSMERIYQVLYIE